MPTENRSSNIYRYTITETSPNDREAIVSSLEIRSPALIRVKHIKTASALIKQSWHEQMAGQLAERFSGAQVIEAVYQGVEIETMRLIG